MVVHFHVDSWEREQSVSVAKRKSVTRPFLYRRKITLKRLTMLKVSFVDTRYAHRHHHYTNHPNNVLSLGKSSVVFFDRIFLIFPLPQFRALNYAPHVPLYNNSNFTLLSIKTTLRAHSCFKNKLLWQRFLKLKSKVIMCHAIDIIPKHMIVTINRSRNLEFKVNCESTS